MIPKPSRLQPVVQENLMAPEFAKFLGQLADLAPIIGTGSPEGVIEAGQSRLYMDGTGTAGAVLYVKQKTDISGDPKAGWILV